MSRLQFGNTLIEAGQNHKSTWHYLCLVV